MFRVLMRVLDKICVAVRCRHLLQLVRSDPSMSICSTYVWLQGHYLRTSSFNSFGSLECLLGFIILSSWMEAKLIVISERERYIKK